MNSISTSTSAPSNSTPVSQRPLKDKGPEEIDFIIVRENTEGLYAGIGGFLKRGTRDEVAIQEMINTYKGVERCVRYAFELTPKAQQGKYADALRQSKRPHLRTRSVAPRL